MLLAMQSRGFLRRSFSRRPTAVSARWLLLSLLTMALIVPVITGMDGGVTVRQDAEPAPCTLDPTFVRVELPDAASQTRILLHLRVPTPTQVLAIDTDCRCVHGDVATPLEVSAGITALPIIVSGLLTGTKAITVRTTLGSATCVV